MAAIIEEDLYGGFSEAPNTSVCCVPAAPLPNGQWPRGYGLPTDLIHRFWQCTLRPLRNDGCNASEIGSDIYFMASVTACDMETCVITPRPDLKMSHVLLHGEDGYYEWTPRRPISENLMQQPVSLLIGLGDKPVVSAETRVPEEFNPLQPFVIIQTHDFFYIRQGLNTRAIPRFDRTKSGSVRKYLTLSFSGLLFTVKYIETTKVEISLSDGLK